MKVKVTLEFEVDQTRSLHLSPPGVREEFIREFTEWLTLETDIDEWSPDFLVAVNGKPYNPSPKEV